MYQVAIKNPGKTVAQGDILSFSISGFPPNTTLDYYISDQKWKVFWRDNIVSDANGCGTFAVRCGNDLKGGYRLYVRNYIYGTANDAFTVVEPWTAVPAAAAADAPAAKPAASAAAEIDSLLQEVEAGGAKPEEKAVCEAKGEEPVTGAEAEPKAEAEIKTEAEPRAELENGAETPTEAEPKAETQAELEPRDESEEPAEEPKPDAVL